MRLMCMFALFAAIVFGALTMVRSNGVRSTGADGTITTAYPPRDDTGLTLTFGFLIAAFAPKAVQKFAEQRLQKYSGLPASYPITTSTAIPVASTPAPVLSYGTSQPTMAEDFRLLALQQELAALRSRLADQPLIQAPAPIGNGTALAVPVLSPLQQIRQGGSL